MTFYSWLKNRKIFQLPKIEIDDTRETRIFTQYNLFLHVDGLFEQFAADSGSKEPFCSTHYYLNPVSASNENIKYRDGDLQIKRIRKLKWLDEIPVYTYRKYSIPSALAISNDSFPAEDIIPVYKKRHLLFTDENGNEVNQEQSIFQLEISNISIPGGGEWYSMNIEESNYQERPIEKLIRLWQRMFDLFDKNSVPYYYREYISQLHIIYNLDEKN